MPLFDFRCGSHGLFEAVSVRNEALALIEPMRCPKCGESSPMVWVKPPGVKGTAIYAVAFGGKLFDPDQFDQQVDAELSFDPDNDADAFFNKPDFYKKYEDAANEKNNLAEYGNLPPLAPTDVHSQKVFAEAMAKKG